MAKHLPQHVEPQLFIPFPKYFGLKNNKNSVQNKFRPFKSCFIYTPAHNSSPMGWGGSLILPHFKHAGRKELPASAGTPEPRDEAEQETDLENLWERGNKIHANCNIYLHVYKLV